MSNKRGAKTTKPRHTEHAGSAAATKGRTMTNDNEEPSAASAGSTGRRHEFRAWLDTSGFRAALSRIAAAFRKQSVAVRPHGPLFSTRVRMEEAAAEWCKNAGVPPTPFNVVTALSSLGLLAEQERIQEWLHG